MSGDDLEPLAEEHRRLVAAAGKVAPAPSEGKARVKARLDATLFGGGGDGDRDRDGDGDGVPATPKPSTTSSFTKLASLFLGGVVVGGVAVYAAIPPRVVERVVEIERDAGSVSAPAGDLGAPVFPVLVAPLDGVPDAAAVARPQPSRLPTDSLTAERALLDPARTALGRGDGANALALAGKHEQRFPTGKLAEEREAIAVQALAALGRKDEARIRGERFLSRYPGSVLTPALRAALQSYQ
jgi:hypothetical protein